MSEKRQQRKVICVRGLSQVAMYRLSDEAKKLRLSMNELLKMKLIHLASNDSQVNSPKTDGIEEKAFKVLTKNYSIRKQVRDVFPELGGDDEGCQK